MARAKTIKSGVNAVQESVDMLADPEAQTESRAVTLLASVKSSAQAAQHAAAQVGPTVGRGLQAAAYQGIYNISYGLTFGILLAGKVIPFGGFVSHAIHDGNTAAKVAFTEREVRLQSDGPEEGATLSA